jgi:glyoxylase-like metal-dependent hydrolase (beta-lactamase superfamily II)
VLTHCHYDHIGGATAFQKATGGRIHLHETEAEPIIAGDLSLTISEMFGSKLAGMDVAPLKEGDKLKCGDSELEVLHTPGHSPGSISLHDPKNRFAIVGDTVFCDGGVGRWDLPGGDLALLKRSIDRLKKLDLTSMYPGHGSYAEGDAGQHMKLASRYIEEAY